MAIKKWNQSIKLCAQCSFFALTIIFLCFSFILFMKDESNSNIIEDRKVIIINTLKHLNRNSTHSKIARSNQSNRHRLKKKQKKIERIRNRKNKKNRKTFREHNPLYGRRRSFINISNRNGTIYSSNAFFTGPSFEFYSNYSMNKYEEEMRSKQLNRKKGVGPEVNPNYISKYNFSICLIPKNGITLWKMVLLRMLFPDSEAKWWELGGQIHKNFAIKKSKLIPINFKVEDIDNIYRNKANQFFVIVRDPLERVLSGYLYFDWYFKVDNFSIFADYLWTLRNAAKSINHHVREQHLFCDLDHCHNRYKQISFSNYTQRKDLLDALGENVWNDIGKNGWHPALHHAINQRLKTKKKGAVVFREYSMDPNVYQKQQSLVDYGSPTQHSKLANTKVLQYYDIFSVKEMLRFYQRDYQLFQLKIPDWICDVIANEMIYNGNIHDLLKQLLEVIENVFDLKQYPICYQQLTVCVASNLQTCAMNHSYVLE